MESKKLSLGTKLGFGVGDIGGNLMFQIMGFWILNYLTDTVGLSAGLAGTALMIGKFWDAFTDPAMGYISDKTKTKMGRRRPYLLSGAVLALIAMVVMFFNPHFDLQNQTLIFIWAVGAYCLLCLAFTVFNIPYSALTPELTSDYHEQTSLNGFRMSFALIGTLLGAGAFLPIVSIFTPAEISDRSIGYLAAGIIFGSIIAIVILITFFTIKEKQNIKLAPPKDIIKSYISAFKNKPFVRVLIPWALNMVGITVISGIMVYYFTYIYGDKDLTQFALLGLLGVAIVSMPLWVKVFKKMEKKIKYMIGLSIIGVASLLTFFLAPLFSVEFMYILMAIAGIGLSAAYVAPWSMIPDAIEHDYVKTGVKKEGVYYGVWTLISKIGQAIAVFIMGWMLDLSGYIKPVKNISVIQPDSAITAIKLLLGPIPFIVLIAGAILVLFYPITAKKYEEIHAVVEKIKRE